MARGKSRRLLACALVLAVCGGCGSSGVAGRRPGHRHRGFLKLTAPVAALAFPTPERGVLSAGHSLFLSTDGGRRWARTLRSPGPVTALSFADPGHGWALTEAHLLGTTNGGRTWSQLAEPRIGALAAVQLVTPRIGYGCDRAGNVLLRTVDAGRSWRALRLSAPRPGSSPCAFCFSSGVRGWALTRGRGGDQIVLETNDGGSTWSESLGVTRAAMAPVLGCSGSTAIYLVSGTPGAGHAPFTVFVTTDAGRRWRAAIGAGSGGPTAHGVPPSRTGGEGAYAVSLDVIDSTAATLLTSCPACSGSDGHQGTLELQSTADAGRHWSGAGGRHAFIPLVQSFGANGVSFPTLARGYLLGPAAGAPRTLLLLRTDDGGRTWEKLRGFDGAVRLPAG